MRRSYSFGSMLFTTTGTKMLKFFVERRGSKKYSSTPGAANKTIKGGTIAYLDECARKID
jgi:hypothetical protein